MPTQLSGFTLSQLNDRVRGDIGLRGNNLLRDEDILAWANEIVGTIAVETQWYQFTDVALSTTSGTREYDLPNDLLALQSVRFLSLALTPVDLNSLEVIEPYHHLTSSGTPYYYALRGATKISFYPAPNVTDSTSTKLDYVALPADVDGTAPSTQKFAVPLGGDAIIIAYCCYRGSIKDIRGEGRDRIPIFKREWEEGLESLKAQMSGRVQLENFVGGSYGRYDYPDAYAPFNPYRTIPTPP